MPEGINQKRIFLLTDGCVNNPDQVIRQASFCKDQIRIHTFGIGSGCDNRMIVQTAKAGRGTCSMVGDYSNELNGVVVQALKKAFEPSLGNCTLSWNG